MALMASGSKKRDGMTVTRRVNYTVKDPSTFHSYYVSAASSLRTPFWMLGKFASPWAKLCTELP